MARIPWTDRENDAIVEDYFAMLEEQIAGGDLNKAQHNRNLQQRINRSRGAIELKHQNISSILQDLGEEWIEGYKPRSHFQSSLYDAVEQWLDRNPDLERLRRNSDMLVSKLDRQTPERPTEASIIPFGPPPTLSNQKPPKELEQKQRLAQKFNAAERDERNRILGRAGEARAYAHEKQVLVNAGRNDLAEQVRWVANEDGDGAGYDIASFSPDGNRRLIEVKTTKGSERTPFHITRNELKVANDLKDEWCLLRLWNFAQEPRAFELRPPLERHVELMPTSYLARIC